MNLRITLMGLSVLFVGFSLGWVASAKHFDHVMPGGVPSLLPERIVSGLGLSEVQRSQILEVANQGLRTEQSLRVKLEEARRELERQVDRSRDIDFLRAKFAVLIAAKSEVENNHFETMMRVHAALTPEQIQKLRRSGPPMPGRP